MIKEDLERDIEEAARSGDYKNLMIKEDLERDIEEAARSGDYKNLMIKEDLERDIEEAASSGDYKNLVLRKQEWMSVHLREISYFLEPLLPSVVNSENLFSVENLKACPESDSCSDRLHIFSRIDPDTGEPAIKFVEDSRGACVPLTRIRTSAVRSIYEKMMEFISKSDLPVYNPESHTGFWSSLSIRVNSVGKSMLVIEVYWLDPQEKSLKPELLNNLQEYLQKSEENLLTVVLKLHSLNSVTNLVLYGASQITENVNNLDFTINPSQFCSWNSAGEEGFCENLIYLCKLEKQSWSLIQIGCLSTVSTITLAAACSHSVVFNVDGEVRDLIITDAKKNSVNLQIVAECTVTSLNGALTQRLSHTENICAVIFDVNTQLKDGDLADTLRSCSKVNRILFISHFKDPALLRRLVLCCSDHDGDTESFIVTRAVPVNLSHFNSNQIIIFVLERRSLVGNTQQISMYNKDRVTEFLWGRKCKYIDAPYKDDDRYFALIPEKTLLQSIFEMIQNGRPKSALEYEEQLKLKQECIWLQGQAVTALLWGVLPKIMKNQMPGFCFPLKALKAPKFDNTLSFTLGAKPVKSENEPKKWTMKYGLIDDNDEITVPLKEIHSPWAKLMYEKTMKFIEDYGYQLYNIEEKSGFWKYFKIKLNPEGLMMVVIGVEVDPEPQEAAEVMISKLESALKGAFKDDNLRSLILKVYLGGTIQYKIVAGIEFLQEEISPFKMFNYHGNMPWMNSNGALEIARVVVDLIAVDSTWSVVQFGRTHDAMFLYIAKCCQVLHVVHDDKETKRCLTSNCQLNLTNQLIMYHENPKGKDFMDIIQYNSSNVCCVIPDFSYYKKNVDVNFLKNTPNVKKIICISKLTDPIFINEIVSLCDGVQSENEAFIIKEVVPVDTSPHDNVIKTVTLLVRQSLVKDEVESNPVFDNEKLQEFYSKSDSEKHTFLGEVCNLVKPCIATNSTRFKFFQSLNLYSVHGHSTSVARRKSQMTADEQIRELQEGSTSEIEEADDPNHEYRDNVAKEIEKTMKKQDFETLWLLKQKWMSLHLKIICNFLKPLIPVLLKNTNPSNFFHIGNFQPCLAANSSSDRLHVFSRVNSVTGEPELKFVADSHGKFFQLTHLMIRNETIKYMYEKMVNLINTSNLTLFNPETCIGTLHSLLIRVNDEGQSFVEIKIFLPLADIKHVIVSSLKILLQNLFEEENLLLSIMLRIKYTETEETETLFGMVVFFESGSNLQLTGSDIAIDWHPAGIEELRKTLIGLSRVQKQKCAFVQIGCLSPVITIGLATLSMYSVVLNVDAYTRELLVVAANQNMILLEATQENSAEAFRRSLTKKLLDCERVCLVVFNSKLGMKDEQFADILIQHSIVDRILFVSLFDDLSHMRKIVACCCKQDEEDKAFLIKKIVPVDMAPCEHSELVICVLERRHAMLSNIVPNVKYNAEKTTAYLQNILPEESSALVSEQVLVKNRIPVLQKGGPTSVKQYKKQMLIEGSTSEIEEADDDNQEYRDSVAEEIEKTMKKQDFETLVLLKQKWMSLHLKIICNFLEPLIPMLLINTNPSNLFHTGDLKPCLATNVNCDRLHVFSRVNSVTGEPELKFVADSHGKFFQLTQSMIHNETIKHMYEKVVNLMNTSNLTLFNPETCTGTLHSLLIRVNSEGQSFIEIKIVLPLPVIKHVFVSSLTILLQDFFNEENLLLSIMLRIQYTDSEETETLFGMAVFFESGSNLQLTGSDIAIDWHPAGIEELRKTLISLSKVKKQTCAFVQIGCLSPVITIGLATLSMYSVVLNVDAYTCEHLVVTANQNMILLEATQENSAEALARSLIKKLPDCERVCLVVFNSKLGMKDEQFADLLIHHSIVERILFVSLFDDLSHLRKIVACCCKRNEEDKIFLITQIVPVDMAPYENSELVICVLERRHAMLANIIPNSKFSAEKTTAYLQNILAEGNSTLVSEQVLLKNIITMLQMGGPTSVKQYKKQIKWKHDLLWLYGKAFCCLLRELIPCVTKTRIQTPGFLFPMKPLKPCVFKETVCSLLYVDCTVCKDGETTPFSVRFGLNDDQNGGFTVPLNEIHSPGISCIFELMVRFIEQSGYELYNPATDTGVWINFKIRLNSKAKALLHISVKPRLELIELLKEYFNPHEDLFESLVLKFLENESGLEKEVIIMGKEYITEDIDGYELNLCEPMSWFDPNGFLQLSKTVIHLSRIDRTWTGIQFGNKYDLGYSIAKNCYKLHVLCKTEKMKKFIWNNAKQVGITNIRSHAMFSSLFEYTKKSHKICLFIPDITLLQTKSDVDAVVNKPNIEKIVCISKFTDPLLVNLVVRLVGKSRNGFLLKEAIPVDMSPHDNCVNVVFLLVRKSSEASNAEENKDFSVTELRKYYVILASQKQTLITSIIDNLTRSFAEFQDEKRQFDRCLSFDWTTYESDKQTLIKEVEEAGNPSVMEVVGDEVNDDVKGDPRCDQEDDSDKQTLIKEIEVSNHSVVEVVGDEVTDFKGDPGFNEEDNISTNQVNENNPSSSELQLLSLIADRGLVLPDNIAKEVEEVLSSQGMKTPNLDKTLVPVKTLNEDIISMIHAGGPKTIDEYHKQLRWKHECTWLQAKAFCSIIACAIPYTVKVRTQGLLFNMNGIKTCPFMKTVSEVLCVKSEVSRNDPDELVMRHRLSTENDTVLSVKSIYSEKVAELYIKMMVVIKSSGYPLHHPKKNTGYWKHFTIRVNSVGDSMLTVTIVSPSQNVGTQTIVSHIKILLLMNFKKSDVDSLVLEVISGFEYNQIVLLGELHLPEIVGNVEVKLCPHALWSNPYGILEVCRAIVNMASLDDTWAVIQLGQGYDVVHFYVAKHCGILHMQCLPIYRNHVVDNAKANLIKNITYSENLTDILKSIELSSYSNICVIIPELIDFDEDAVCLIKDEPKIKKIICVSEFTDPLFIDRIVSSCYDEQNSEKSFVIKDITPVDNSPWDNLVKIVALLTRKNRVKVDHNQEFSNEQSKELLAMTDTVKQHRLIKISDLIEPFVATHDEKSLYDRTLKFRRENECYNEHKDNSGYSDKNILKYTVSKYVTSNKFYSEIEKILISDKPKTHDLYKNILSHKEVAATSLVDSLRGMIKPFQVFFFTGEKEIVENLKTCPVVPTLSERIYVPLANKSLNPQTSARSLVYNDLYRRCQTDPGRRTYNLLMQFIRKSEYRIYNPSKGSGLWDSFLIRTDSTGNVYIVVVVQHLRKDNKKVDPPTLVSMLKQHLVDTRCPDYNVVSINVRVMERGSLKLESEFGPQMATEVIDDFHLKFNFKNILTYNRYGIKNLCTAVVELAELDKKWQVLQVGTECGIDVFHLAKKCNWVHYAERDKKFGIDIMVEKNTAKNITVWTLQNKKIKLQKILENLKDQENICVVEYFTRDFEAPLNKENDEFLPPAALRKCTNVKKIIYVSELSDSSWESKLKICCLLKEDWEDPFVIKKFLTIDMSPFDNHIMLVCLLTRDIEFGVKSNPDYSPFKVRNELIKSGYLVVRMKHKNIISSALPLPAQRKNKGHNIHNTQKSEIDRKRGRSPCISRETKEIPHVLRLKRSKSPVKDESRDRKVPRLNSPERTATKYPHILGSVGSGAKQDQKHLIKPLKFSLEETLKSVRANQCKRTSIDTSIKNTTTSSDLNQNNPSNSGQSQQMPPTASFKIPSTISNSGQYQLIPPTTTTKIATTISSSMQKPSEGNIVNFTESGTGINKEYVSLKTFPLRETVVSMSQYHKPETLPVDGNMLRRSGFDVMPVENNPTKSNTFEEFLAKEILHRSTHGSKKTLPVEETTIEESQCETHKGVSVARNTVRKSRFDVHFKGSTAKRDIFEEVPIKKTMEKDAAHNVVKRYSLKEASLKSSALDDTERLPVEKNTGNKSTYYEHFKESTKKINTFEEVPSKNTMEKEVAHNVVKRDPLKEASLKSSSRDETERLRKEENVKKSRYYEYFKASTAKSDTFEEMPIRKTMEKEAVHNVKSYPLKEASSKSSTHDYTERLPKEQNVKSYLLKEASLKSSSRDDTERFRKEKNVKKSRYYEYFKASTAKSDTFEEMPIRKTMEKEAVHNVKSYPLKEASSKSSTHDYTERLPKEQNVKSYLLKEASLKSSSRDETERLRKEENVKKSRYYEYFKASTAKSDTFEEMPIRKTMEKEAVHNVKSYPLKEASSKSSTHDYTERLPKEQNVKSYLLKEASLKSSSRDDTERLRKEKNVKKSRYYEYFKASTAKSDTFEEMPIRKTMEKEAFHSAVKRCPLKEASLKSSAHDEIEGNVVNKSRFDVHCMESTAESDTFEEVAIQNTMEKEVAHNVVKRCPLKEASLKDSVHDDDTERLRVENSLLKSLLGLLFEKDAAENDTLEEAPVTKSVEYSQRILTEYLDEESGVQNSEYYVPQELTLGKNNLQSSGVDRLFEANNKISDTLMEFLKNKSVAQSSRLDVLPVSNDAKYRLDDTSVKTLSQNSSDDMFQRGLFNENMAPIAKEHVLKRGVVRKIAQSYEYGLPARDFIEQSKRPSNFEYATTSSCERDLLHVGEDRNRMKLVHKFGITEGVPEHVPEKLTLWRPRTSQDYTTNISPSNTVDDLFCRRNDLRSQHDTVSQEIIDIKPCDRLGSTADETDVYPKRSTLDKEDLSAACARLQNFFRK